MTEFWLDGSDEGKALGDLVVQGRPVREWKVSDFNGDVNEMRDFEVAVWASTSFGNHLHDIFGQEFHDDFYSRRTDLILRERRNDLKSSMEGSVTALVGGRCKVRLVHMFQVPHVGWEMDNDYAVFDVDGSMRLFGTDHGGIREFDYADLARIKMTLSASMNGVEEGLKILAEAARTTR